TVPHKEGVLSLLDRLAPEAQAVGAVNTLVAEGGRWVGHNTDIEGVRAALAAAGCAIQGQRVLVLGAGGAARAAAYALLSGGAAVRVLARRPAQAEHLAQALGRWFPPGQVEAGPLNPAALPDEAAEVDGLVQATPVGLWPRVEGSLWPDSAGLPARLWVFDLVYRPLRTRLLRQATDAGGKTVDGVGMLVHQGAAAFRLWTGVEPPLKVMAQACLEAWEPKE
ncbi:MAG: shikimate dehydrogenase, partial [Chloroflexi bacterium]|nr:shikimate dehydrogenase [Chloroflexota bacterium]